MVDDLVTLGTKEPYRMFTSRAEYRLLLREDNADIRLREIGHSVGLVDEATYAGFCRKREQIQEELERVRTTRLSLNPEEKSWCERHGCADLQKGASYEQLLRRPGIGYEQLREIDWQVAELPVAVREQVEIQVKYQGYIERQLEQIERMRKQEEARIPADLDYSAISGLTSEVREKLERFRPDTLGQAARIQGVTPAAIAILSVMLKGRGDQQGES
jgi:tRNA uridine 5-carboxymethylaminomethyl modification enzyme